MTKLSRTDEANIGDLRKIRERKMRKKRILDKKILDLQTELNVIEGEIRFWEEQIEKISGMSYAETMAYMDKKSVDEPKDNEESIETESNNIFQTIKTL